MASFLRPSPLLLSVLGLGLVGPWAASAFVAAPPPPAASARPGASVSLAERLEGRANSLKCPFFKRRFLDAAAAARESQTWFRARHKSLLGLGGAWDADADVALAPARALSPTETLAVVTRDFDERQYYVTGGLTRDIYHPRCFFDSPDPDMPVRSPEIFASALRGLFDNRLSSVELLEAPRLVAPRTIVAEWRLEGALRLPWRPPIKPFVGRTTFSLDEDGLVARHVEEWSLSAADAFLSAIFPRLGWGAPPAPDVAALRASRAPAGPDGATLAERWPAIR